MQKIAISLKIAKNRGRDFPEGQLQGKLTGKRKQSRPTDTYVYNIKSSSRLSCQQKRIEKVLMLDRNPNIH